MSGRWSIGLHNGEKFSLSIDKNSLQLTETHVTFKLGDGTLREVKYRDISKCTKID